MFQQVREKALREILRIVHSVAAAAHETVKRRPIGLAKLRQCGLRNLRFGLASAGREHDAPAGRRKQIAPTVAVPRQSSHLNGLYQNRRRKASHRKKVKFRAARAPESVCKGKLNYQKERKKMTLLTELKDKAASFARLLTAAMTSTLLLGILAPSGSAGTNDGVLNYGKTTLLLRHPSIITFDAPGSGTGPGQGTITFAINPAGTISGRYADAGGAIHGILRAPDGAIITFDAPGAGTGPRQGTRPFSINPAGTSAGYFNDATGVFHGFLRTPDGAITIFDIPGAGTGPGQGTFAGNINPSDAIAGRYVDASGVAHGFLRAPDGTFTTFDAPNAGTGPGQGTFVFTGFCLNPARAIAGASVDASDVYRGVLRAPDGTITTFDVPGAGTGSFQGTITLGINHAGTIERSYLDS